MIKKGISILCIFIINLFTLLSKYSIIIKGSTIFLGTIIVILCLVKRKMVKLWIGIYATIMIILNIVCFSRLHYVYITASNDTYNKNTKWMTTQTDYTWNTGNCDVILSSIFRDRIIHIPHDEKYTEYICYYSKDVCLLDDQINYEIKFQHLQEKFISIGRMSPQISSWLWSDNKLDELSELRQNYETTPRIYVSSEYVADESDLVAVSDEGYNLYIWTYEEYEKMLDEV